MEALDTLAHRDLVELDMVRSQLCNAEATLKMVCERSQENPPEGAPYDEVRDIPVVHEDPAPEPPRKKFCVGNSREYLRRFTPGAGPSRPARDPTPLDDEEEEDPEEVVPITDDEPE